MKKFLKFFCVIALICSSELSLSQTNCNQVSTNFYELYTPNTTEAVLILFGGYPENSADIRREFPITELALKNNIAVAYLNYSGRLWLEENEKVDLSESIHDLFKSNDLPIEKVIFGGFSSGGNMALLIADYLIENSKKIKPAGVFSIDSPIDLIGLYKSAEKTIEKDYSEPAVQEAKWIISTLDQNFGKPEENIQKYEAHSVYTSKTERMNNLENLKTIPMRLYAEPDLNWWKENRNADPDQMNAYYLKKLSEKLKNSGFKQVTYITTQHKGYRANGSRHPHSWSIVDKTELLEWILKP